MESRIGDGGAQQHIYRNGGESGFVLKEKDLMGVGKKSLEWNLNDWKWDGDLFVATPLKNAVPLDCRRRRRSREFFPAGGGGIVSNSTSSSISVEVIPQKGNRDSEEKRRRVVVIEDDDDELLVNGGDEAENNLTLKLGENVYPINEAGGGGEAAAANCDGKNGKKAKVSGTGTTNRGVCQVQNCGDDLSNAKDYHRRHKVCEMHSKATQALVNNVMQRFCQQCSRFHLLQEFDEGKRSCRRRLDGHNKRRRKPNPDTAVNGNSLNDDQTSSYLLIALLRILTNIHSNNSDQTKDQDILSHLLRNLASLANTFDGSNISGFQQGSQELINVGNSAGISSKKAPGLLSNSSEPSRFMGSTSTTNGCNDPQDPHASPIQQYVNVVASEMRKPGVITDNAWGGSIQTISPKTKTLLPKGDNHPARPEVPVSTTRRSQLNDIDLNSMCTESQDCTEGLEMSHQHLNLATTSPDCPLWIQHNTHQSSPTQTSGNSDTASAQSPSSSNGDGPSRTDRIVFKLFGKYPNDFPLVLRAQVLDWLSHSPTDIESYIRPGCIVLTIYLRLAESMWEELCSDLSSNLSRLLDISDDPFWRTGWVYARVQHQVAFINDGQVVLDMPLPFKEHNDCKISSITPLALSVSETAQFRVKGFNLFQPRTRLLCALEGKYLVHEAIHDLVEGTDPLKEDDEIQCLSFTCSIPEVTGRGFIEVDDCGLSSSSFPFIVAEKDVCSEICMLESAIDAVESDDDDDDDDERRSGKLGVKDQALNFIHETGWLLHRSGLRSKLGHMDPNTDSFPFIRFRGLMEFAMDHDWCAVARKLLNIFLEGTVDAGGHTSVESALSEMGLLHKAVRRNCRMMVELLLRYAPPEHMQRLDRGSDNYLFRPDAVGPGGLTPLHIAASTFDSGNVLDALTNDPGSVGIVAWKSVHDNAGCTPEDYARLRGHYSYIHLVQKKINKKSETNHVIIDIPRTVPESNTTNHQKQTSAKLSGLQIDKTQLKTAIQQSCKLCDQKLVYRRSTPRFLGYRPAMLSLVAIATVCVCLGLLFKSSPEVLCVFPPFRWEMLEYGSM